LDVVRATLDEALESAWRRRVQRAATELHWPEAYTVARRHSGGVLLALSAPFDQLLLATEVNEWALCAALLEREPARWQGLEKALLDAALEAAGDEPSAAATDPVVLDDDAALARFARLAAIEMRPALRELLDAARARDLSYVLDEDTLTLGAGIGARGFPVEHLPGAAAVDWQSLSNIPTAVVTGSNGKTTTVRLLAACCRAAGLHTAYNCTDGVYLDDEAVASGDYSGPAGARLALRHPRAQAAILETARGGILRRGIAVSRAHVAIVTNVSSDHFGEYGIDTLADLAEVKLSVAAVIGPAGLLILNADDAQLRAHVAVLGRRLKRIPPLGWFSAAPDSPPLRAARTRGDANCGPRDGNLILSFGGREHDLGVISAMPLSMDNVARYNVENLAGSALAAATLGIDPSTIARVLLQFGAKLSDNPGRMMRIAAHGVTVLIDYAHNPDGLQGFLEVAGKMRGASGRLGMLLGQAGNRQDADVRQLVQVAVGHHPDLIVVKENLAQLRGRAPGEMTRLMRAELRRLDFPDAAVAEADDEFAAARCALAWARPGDVLALPLHSATARAALLALLRQS
jgi:cyanophycin synthetase